jgi:hypothetical protein
VNTPEVQAMLQQYAITHKLTAEEINQLRDRINWILENFPAEFDPATADLADFLNESDNPFVRESDNKKTQNHLFSTAANNFSLGTSMLNFHQSRLSNLNIFSNLGLTLGNGVQENNNVLNLNNMSDITSKSFTSDYLSKIKKIIFKYRRVTSEISIPTDIRIRVSTESKYNTDLQLVCDSTIFSNTIPGSLEGVFELEVLNHLPLLNFSGISWCVKSNTTTNLTFNLMRLIVITEQI